jgi:hypothetical protein
MATMRREATGLATEALITTSGPGEPGEREGEACTADGEEERREGEPTTGRIVGEGRGIARQRDNIARKGGEEEEEEEEAKVAEGRRGRKCSTNSHILVMERRIKLIRRHH